MFNTLNCFLKAKYFFKKLKIKNALSIYKIRAWYVKKASIKKLMHNKKGLSTGLTKRYRNLKKRLVEAASSL